jgi:hypothetical protein
MENKNKGIVQHNIKMPKESALAFSRIILKYISLPCLDQVIMLPDDNETPLTLEHYITVFNSLPLKYIYNKYLSDIIAYEDVSNIDFFAILDFETKKLNEPNFLTLEYFKFYIIDKDNIKEIELPSKYKKHLFIVLAPTNSIKKVRAIAFSSLFKYNNNVFMNNVFNSFRNNMNDDEFSTFMEAKYNNALRYIQNKKIINLFNTCADFWDKQILQVSYQNYEDVDMKDQYNIIFKHIVNFVKQKINSLDPILKKSIYEASGIRCPTSDTKIDKPYNIGPLITQINNLPETFLH